MKVIKILVESREEAQAIINVLESGEQNGEIDFAFGLKVSDDLTLSVAQTEFKWHARVPNKATNFGDIVKDRDKATGIDS